MRHAAATPDPAPPTPPGAPTDLLTRAASLLATPGLVVLTGGPGSGRSTRLRQLGAAFAGPVFSGGALSALRTTPAFALTRALRVRLPDHDRALLVEAVRARVHSGLLLLDDLQWADPLTLDVLTEVAASCRVAAALRTPYRLAPPAVAALRATAVGWLPVPPLAPEQAAAMATTLAPGLGAAAAAEVARRSGGVPLAVWALARRATTPPRRRTGRDWSPEPATDPGDDQVTYAVAAALADLTRPARTALAALGLLGRPAPAGLLGPGVAELTAAGLVHAGGATPTTGGGPRAAGTVGGTPATSAATGSPAAASAADPVAPVSPYLAEVAAGLLDDHGRRALHRRLADRLPPAEAVRHLAAAGEHHAAYHRAVAAAATAGTTTERAELLLFACAVPGRPPDVTLARTAAAAALTAGRPHAAVRVLTAAPDAASDPAAAVLRGEALVLLGELAAAHDAVTVVPEQAPAPLLAARDRVLLLAALAEDPAAAAAAADRIAARHGPTPRHAGLAAAVAATRAAVRAPGWEQALASAVTAADAAGDPLSTRWSAWLLVESLTADGRLDEARTAARAAARACTAELAYGWQTRFLAADLWCAALGGAPAESAAVDLTDRALPAQARGYLVAAVSLVEADGGLLATARARLTATDAGAGPLGRWLAWLAHETAWLDGQPTTTGPAPAASLSVRLPDGLAAITTHWARHDRATDGRPRHDHTPPHAEPDPTDPPYPPQVARTLTAWRTRDPAGFAAAAAAWRDRIPREQVRCLLAQAAHEPDPARAVSALLAAEELTARHALVVLRGRVHRALRRHGLRRDPAGTPATGPLTGRERDVLRLVAAGEPSRRIAGRLGLSVETVETHIRAGMRKLGARTRTEAAARALPQL